MNRDPSKITIHSKCLIGYALSCLLLSGCSSLKTLSKDGQMEIRSPSFNTRTYCPSVPRVFGGFSLSFCTNFVGPPANLLTDTDDLLLFAIFDMSTSAVADILVLPYTGLMQIRYGNLPINQAPDDFYPDLTRVRH